MRWLVLNGSPRGANSNTHVMLEMIRRGVSDDAAWEEVELRRTRDHQQICTMLTDADGIILAYPLYTDSMPGIVVAFLEALSADEGTIGELRARHTPVAYLVHSGFPEGVHTAHLDEVHQRLSEKFGVRYLGTVRKPGSEGIRLMPPFMLRSVSQTFRAVGRALSTGEDLSTAGPQRLVKFERFGWLRRLLVRLAMAVGMMNTYWNSMLRRHGAWDHRFDAPYGEPYQDGASQKRSRT